MDTKERLKTKVMAGAAWRWAELSPNKLERLDQELNSLERSGAIDYMLMCSELVATIKEVGGCVGMGRGACVGSAVCFALGITNVDPFVYGLFFERFCNPQRRAKVFVGLDCDTVGARAARVVLCGKYGGIEHVDRHKGPDWPCFFDLPGGWTISLTGTPEVDRLADALAAAKGRGPTLLDLPLLPDDDTATMALFRCGETNDIPFFDSLVMRRTLAALPDLRFSDLVAMNALIRMEMGECHQDVFLRARIKGVRSRHPLLAKCLSETYGVMLYQEQLMEAVMLLGGLTGGEADQVRKAFGYQRFSVYVQMRKEFVEGCVSNSDFRVGSCREESQARKCAKRLWKFFYDDGLRLIMRAHHLAETRLAYLLAYMKAHYGVTSGVQARRSSSI